MKQKVEILDEDDSSTLCESTVNILAKLLLHLNYSTNNTKYMAICVNILQASLTEGCRLSVRMHKTADWPLAEIVSIKEHEGKRQYYVHYVDCEFRNI